MNKFTKGEEVYILDLNRGRSDGPKIRKDIIEKIGRKYITTEAYYYQFLVKEPNCSTISKDIRLCKTEEEAKQYIMDYENVLKIRRFSRWEKLTPAELQQIVDLIEK